VVSTISSKAQVIAVRVMITLREPYSTNEPAAGAWIADGDFAVWVFDILKLCLLFFFFYEPSCITTI
jgi:hypothetical protein